MRALSKPGFGRNSFQRPIPVRRDLDQLYADPRVGALLAALANRPREQPITLHKDGVVVVVWTRPGETTVRREDLDEGIRAWIQLNYPGVLHAG